MSENMKPGEKKPREKSARISPKRSRSSSGYGHVGGSQGNGSNPPARSSANVASRAAASAPVQRFGNSASASPATTSYSTTAGPSTSNNSSIAGQPTIKRSASSIPDDRRRNDKDLSVAGKEIEFGAQKTPKLIATGEKMPIHPHQERQQSQPDNPTFPVGDEAPSRIDISGPNFKADIVHPSNVDETSTQDHDNSSGFGILVGSSRSPCPPPPPTPATLPPSDPSSPSTSPSPSLTGR